MKRLFILAAATVALASCAKTQVVYNEEPQEIAFKTVSGVMTKANAEWNAESSKMGVFAVLEGENYIDNKAFVKEDSEIYFVGEEQSYYWPFGKTLDFVAYAPHKESVTYDPSTNELTMAIDNSNVGNQTDVLYGGEKLDQKDKQDGAMDMLLKHALAKISINIKSDKDNIVTITSLKVTGTYQKETVTVDYSDSDQPDVQWTNTHATTTDMELFNNVEVSTTGSDNYCYVVPAKQTTISIDYTLSGGSPLNYTETLPSESDWIMGKNYVYNINFGASEIMITPNVEPWVTDTNNDSTPGDEKDIPVDQDPS